MERIIYNISLSLLVDDPRAKRESRFLFISLRRCAASTTSFMNLFLSLSTKYCCCLNCNLLYNPRIFYQHFCTSTMSVSFSLVHVCTVERSVQGVVFCRLLHFSVCFIYLVTEVVYEHTFTTTCLLI